MLDELIQILRNIRRNAAPGIEHRDFTFGSVIVEDRHESFDLSEADIDPTLRLVLVLSVNYQLENCPHRRG
jgi:nitrogen-specific signal transduction histidine kinase